MSRGTRWLIVVVTGVVLLAATTAALAAASVYQSGSIGVEVRHDGGRISLRVPAGLARAALALAPAELVDEAVHDVRPYLGAVNEAWNHLTDAPDCLLFELQAADDRIRVEKRDSRLLVWVRTDGSSVRVEVPLRVVSALLGRIA